MSTPQTAASAVGAWIAPERRPLSILLSTGFLSLMSNQLTGLAVPWFVLELTGSATKMGLVAAATLLPSVLMMFIGGAVADRMSPRKLSAFSDVLSGLTVMLVPVLYAMGYLSFPLLLVLMVAGALFDTPGHSARGKLLPELANRGKIQIERVASVQGIFQAVSMIFGAVLAGILIATLGATNVLYLNAFAFAVSAGTMLLLIPEVHVPREELPSVLDDIKVGVRYVVRHTVLGPIVVCALVINGLFAPLTAVLLPYLANTQWDSATRLGILFSGFGAGALIGSIAAGTLSEQLSRSNVFRISLVLLSLPMFLLVPVPGLAASWIAVFCTGIGSGLVNPVLMALMYRITAPELLGRVNGVIGAGAMVAAPLGVLAIAPILDALGLSSSFMIIAVGVTLLAIWATFISPLMREIDLIPKGELATTGAEASEPTT